jgi:uracil-DNA glycosylase
MSFFDILQALIEFRSPNVFNPWRDYDQMDMLSGGPIVRQERLLAHFDCAPEFMLIGEAPGYQGCHFSGVPFTNEKLICSGKIPRVAQARFTTRDNPWSEPSATVIWSTLHDLGIASTTVLWNAFAWHPYAHGPYSDRAYNNRAPTKDELTRGSKALNLVLGHFLQTSTPPTIVAVGRIAQKTLTNLGVKYDAAVRHPSMGGATEFRQTMKKIVTEKL